MCWTPQGAIHFEDNAAGPGRAERVMSLYKRAISGESKPALTDSERRELSERSVTFADLHCDAATAEQAAAAHAALVRLLPRTDAKKRAAEDASGAGSQPLFGSSRPLGRSALWQMVSHASPMLSAAILPRCWSRVVCIITSKASMHCRIAHARIMLLTVWSSAMPTVQFAMPA